jgi:capsular polysaccharide biosynthesis protein
MAVTVKDWCVRHGAPYCVVVPARMGITYQPRYDEPPGIGETCSFGQPEIYVAEVDEASICGGTDVIHTYDGQALLDIACTPRCAARYDLGGELESWNSASVVPLETGIFLKGMWATNYFHWLVEHLSRLMAAEQVPADIPLLVDRVGPPPQAKEALRAMSKREIIWIEPRVEYRVGRLFVPNSPVWLAPNLRGSLQLECGDFLIAREAVEFLRAHLGRYAKPTRRIYIARPGTPVRLLQEPAVRKVFTDLGFEVVRPEKMTFAEQQTVFGAAAVIAGESGAGLTNVLLAPPTTTLLCVTSYETPVNPYSDLVGHAGQPSLFLTGTRHGDSYQAQFTMDVGALKATLERIL